jgi:integrase
MGDKSSRSLHRLSALAVGKLSAPGYHADGGGLYLQVSASASKSWVFRFKLAGRAREMGLGPLHTITLADARSRAGECRKMLLDGIDPIEARNASRSRDQLDAAKSQTFDQCAAAYIKSHKGGWKNAKHASQWENTLATYVTPKFGKLAVQDVDTALVVQALEPIWQTKPETAGRVRGRIESILDWATVHKYRAGENPARWRGHLEKILPARAKVRQVEHHAALPYADIASFMTSLSEQAGSAARALNLLILTATRTNEAIGARRDEFDLTTSTWTIPPERMKGKRQHRVPLSAAAVSAVRAILESTKGDFLFPGSTKGKTLSNMAMLSTLKRMKRADLTVHGFRSTFRDWAAECTTYPNEMAEMALAHTVGDKVEAAYRRGDMFEKRRQMMDDWAGYCTGKPTDSRSKDL